MNSASYNSRLQKKYERSARLQILLFIGGSIVLLGIFAVYGLPALFNLSGAISGLKSPLTVKNNVGPAPSAPRLSANYEATNSALLTVFGVADPKLTVQLLQNGRSSGTVIVDSYGKFSFDVTLDSGSNIFQAIAIADNSNRSNLSVPINVNYLKGQPKLDLSQKDGDSFSTSPVSISGKTDPGNSINVNDHMAIVSSDGSFMYLINLASGDNKITVIASDQAGNQTKKELTLKLN